MGVFFSNVDFQGYVPTAKGPKIPLEKKGHRGWDFSNVLLRKLALILMDLEESQLNFMRMDLDDSPTPRIREMLKWRVDST